MTKEICIKIDDSLYKDLQWSLERNEDNIDDLLTSMLMKYVSETLDFAKRKYPPPSASTARDNPNYGKANKKIPLWSTKPEQNNHKIIRAFLQLSENGSVLLSDLERRCSDNVNHPDVFVRDFRGNFASMKTDSGKSHGKVFEVSPDGYVTVWDEVLDTFNRYKNMFYQPPTGQA